MTNGLTDEAIAAYAAELLDLEDDIEGLQDDKKAVYGNIREAYGKRAADALKLAIKRLRMDSDKLAAAEEMDAEAERFLSVIRNPSAPRATRTREIIEEIPPHDEDGVILDTSSRAEHVSLTPSDAVVLVTSPAGAEGEVDRQPITETPDVGSDAGEQASGDGPCMGADLAPESPAVAPPSAEPDRSGDAIPFSSPAPVETADRSKPHPFCKDPEDCGVEASWNHMCLSCHRVMEKAQREGSAA